MRVTDRSDGLMVDNTLEQVLTATSYMEIKLKKRTQNEEQRD